MTAKTPISASVEYGRQAGIKERPKSKTEGVVNYYSGVMRGPYQKKLEELREETLELHGEWTNK